MSATVRTVASRAHVSPTTVSRVLHNDAHVDEATRALVLQAAEELGYPLKGATRTGRVSRSVLLLVRDDGLTASPHLSPTGREFERKVSMALQSVFERSGFATRLQRTRMEPSEVPGYTNDPGVAGLVLLGGMLNRDFVCALQAAKEPFVVVGAHVKPLEVNCVMADYSDGMQKVVSHLASIGRKHIAMINGPSTTTSSEEKYKGFRLGLALNDLVFSPAQIVVGDTEPESGYVQTLRLLNQSPNVDAIAYADDLMSLGGLRALKESGRRVPEDIAVTGYYDYAIGRFGDPPLTSVHFDMEGMGVIAAHRLTNMLDGSDGPVWCVSVPTSLVIRESSVQSPSDSGKPG